MPVHPGALRCRPLSVLAAGAAAALALTACGGSPQAGARPGPSGSAAIRAYTDCLLGHAHGGGFSGARKACESMRPASGLGPAIRQFTACLRTHGVPPPPSPGPGTGTGGRAGAGGSLPYLARVRSGDQAERAAFTACESRL